MIKKTARRPSKHGEISVEPTSTYGVPDASRKFMRNAGEYLWLILIAIITASLVVIEAPIILRTIFGLPMVLFIPGYIIAGILFPLRGPLDVLERVALSVGLSIAVVSIIVLAVEYSPAWLSSTTVISALLLVTIPGAMVATVRRSRAPIDDRYVPTLRPAELRPQRGSGSVGRFMVGVIALSLLVFAISAALIVVDRLKDEPITELALLTADGAAQSYDRQVTLGESATVLLEVTNREGKTLEYEVVARAGGTEVGRVDRFTVDNGDSQRVALAFQLKTAGEQLPVVFDLYRLDLAQSHTPYRSVTLVVTAVEP